MKVNHVQLFTLLKRISGPLSEDMAPTLSNKVIRTFKESLNDPRTIVASSLLLRNYVTEKYNEETADVLFEKLEEHEFISPAINKFDIGTPEGYIHAMEEVMAEMMSGAAIGGAFDGAQTNAAANATGMAAPTGPSKKKKSRIEKIMSRRL